MSSYTYCVLDQVVLTGTTMCGDSDSFPFIIKVVPDPVTLGINSINKATRSA